MTQDRFHHQDSFSLLSAEQQMAVRYQLQTMRKRAVMAGLGEAEMTPLLAQQQTKLADLMLMDGATAKHLMTEFQASQASLAAERSSGR
jgi:tRNA A22 N-methylase